MSRRVFYSFHYEKDCRRVQQVINMGVVSGQKLLNSSDWEEVKAKGDPSVKRWIDGQLNGCSCLVVLIGTETAERPFVQYEITKAYELKMGIVGVYIHNLTDMDKERSAKGKNPFSLIQRTSDGCKLDQLVEVYDPSYFDTYQDIQNNLEGLVERAIR